MTQFSKKVLTGQPTTDAEWTEHLRQAHEAAPSMSPLCFENFKLKRGVNSYQWLAGALDQVPGPAPSIVDLACGDGTLIPYVLKQKGDAKIHAVDMSEGELTIARAHHGKHKNVQIRCEKAQSLSLPDGSVDAVLCHMAFMLMLPVEPVVAELSRILKPGGIFAAVVGNPKKTDGRALEMLKLIKTFIQSRFPDLGQPRMGDPRVDTSEGLESLLNPSTGFRIERIEEEKLQIRMAAEKVSEWWKDMYFVSLIPDAERAELNRILNTYGRGQANSDGQIEFETSMRLIEVRKLK